MVGATVVLTNGSIKQASESENPDLFWGLLGVGQTSASQPISTCKPSLRRKCASVPYSSCPTPEIVNKLVATINDLHETRPLGCNNDAVTLRVTRYSLKYLFLNLTNFPID